MKSIMMALLTVTSLSSYSAELVKSDYSNIKSALRKEISKSMLDAEFIQTELWEGSLSEIYITTDILSNEDFVSAKVIVLPGEENCNCQDVFEAYVNLDKKNNYWYADKDSLKVIHFPTDQ